MADRPLSFGKRVAFAGLAFLLFFGASEALLWGVANVLYQRNVAGLNPGERVDDGVFRIATFGDSVTAGQGTAPAYSYPRQLETLLRESNPDGLFEVVNQGVYALNSSRLADLLPGWLEQHDPDLIVVMPGCNNGWNYTNSHLVDLGLLDRHPALQLLDRTRTYRFLRRALKRRKGTISILEPPEPPISDGMILPPDMAPEVDGTAATHERQMQLFVDRAALDELLAYDLALITERATEYGSKILLMSYPFEPYGHDHRGVLLDFARKKDLLSADNFAVFEDLAKTRPDLDPFSADRGHPNALGYRLVAHNIYESMRARQDDLGLTLAEPPDPLAEFKDQAYLEQSLSDLVVETAKPEADEYTWEARGHVEIELDRWSDAEASFRRAFELSRGAPQFFESLVYLYFRTGEQDKLLSIRDEMLKLSGDRSDIDDIIEGMEEDMADFNAARAKQ